MLFIPLGTTRPHWRTPWLTYALMALCALTFLVQLAVGEAMPEGFVPAHPSPGVWLLSIFMHADLLHLAGNLLFLWLFGTLAEDVLGRGLFLAFFLGGNVGATLLDWASTAAAAPEGLQIPRVGASGAIAAIMGLASACFLRTKVRVGYLVYWRAGVAEIAAPVFLGLWVAWELIQGFVTSSLGLVSGVAHWAHVGGFLVGLGGALALRLPARIAREDLLTGRHGADESVGRYAELSELEQMVRRSPEDAEAWRALGTACEGLGRLARAREAYHRAVTLFLRQHRPREAARAYLCLAPYEEAQSIPPELYLDLACGLEEEEKFEKAYHFFRLAADHRPGTPDAETALIRAGEIAFTRLHSKPDAAECYRLLLERYPDSPYCALARTRLALLPKARPLGGPRAGREEVGPRHSDLRPLGPRGGEPRAERDEGGGAET